MLGKKALLVDDSKSARFVLGKLLERHNFDVEMAASAEEALELLERTRPDAIFMDHLMKGMDGLVATSIIKKNPGTAHIPIVMCTSNDGDAYLTEAKSQGALGTLVKPPSAEKLDEILIAIDKAIDNNQSVGEVLAKESIASIAPAPAPPPGLSIEEIDSRIETTLKSLLGTRLEVIEASVEAQFKRHSEETRTLLDKASSRSSGDTLSRDEISLLMDTRLTEMEAQFSDQMGEMKAGLASEILSSAGLARLVQEIATETAISVAEEKCVVIARKAAQSSAQEIINPALDAKISQQLTDIKHWSKSQSMKYALFAALAAAGVAAVLHFAG